MRLRKLRVIVQIGPALRLEDTEGAKQKGIKLVHFSDFENGVERFVAFLS
jgi:hypothetical protein